MTAPRFGVAIAVGSAAKNSFASLAIAAGSGSAAIAADTLPYFCAPSSWAEVDVGESVAQPPSSPPTGALTEADFRAIVASLSGAPPLVPQVSAAAPAIPGSSSSVDGEKGGPWAAAPQITPAAEMYSLPGVPAMPVSPPTAPPSGADLAAVPSAPAVAGISAGGGRTDPWASAPNFPGPNEVFSFPRAPGASVPAVPEVVASQPNLPEVQSAPGAIPVPPPAVPIANAPHSTQGIPKSAPSLTIPEAAADSSDAEKAAHLTAAPKFPSISEMFSFPGVLGVQSPPGVPVLPSSIPTDPPTEAELRAPLTAPAGTSAARQLAEGGSGYTEPFPQHHQ